MKRTLGLPVVLAVTLGVSLAGCEIEGISSATGTKFGKVNNTANGSVNNVNKKVGDGFLDQTDGSASLQSGRSIVRDTVAMLQADVEMQIGSSLADDPTFGATRAVQQVAQSTANTTGTGTANAVPPAVLELQQQLGKIERAAQPLLAKKNHGVALTDAEKKQLEELTKEYLAIRQKLEAQKPTPPPPVTGHKPAPRPPEPPKADTVKKPEPPKDHNRPEAHVQLPTVTGGVSITKPQTGSADVEALRKKLEELQAANEYLRKKQEELKHQTDELRQKLSDLAKKKEEQEKKHKEAFKQNVTKDVFDNGDGTLTYAMNMATVSKGATVSHEVQKTVDALDKSLISESSLLKKELSNGATMVVGRTFKQNQEEGTSAATFDSEITRNGKTKKVSWNKTTNADGSSSAEGTITKPDGTVIHISIEKDTAGATRTVAEDANAKVKAEVEKGELDTTANAKITDTAEGKLLAEVEISDTESVKPTAE